METLLRRGKAILKPADTILHTCKLKHFRQRILSFTLHDESKLLHVIVRVFDDYPDLIAFEHIKIFWFDRKPHRAGIAQIAEGSYRPDKKTLGFSRIYDEGRDKNCCEGGSRPEPALRPASPHLLRWIDPLDISLSFLDQLT